ncbi:MAG: GGDEF domain-containing protein [Methylobacterium mesophilicum]|nr:GGDEF domain-containing protein [Methylobacterium mesophilicum]
MRLYTLMARLRRPSSYVGRIFLLCFVGTHVPLLALAGFAVWNSFEVVPLSVFLVILVATLFGTGLTLVALVGMLEPVKRSAEALVAYSGERRLPDLPAGHSDHAGILMRSVRDTIETLDDKLSELSQLSYTDELTGCRNRRWMNEHAIPRLEEDVRQGARPSLLVLDLDGFKQVNDNWGHAVGDEALLVVADALRASTRRQDAIVRTGGDEFCVFLHDTDGQRASEIAERIGGRIAQEARGLAIGTAITASIGRATWQTGDAGFLALYRRADEDLYAKKRRRPLASTPAS